MVSARNSTGRCGRPFRMSRSSIFRTGGKGAAIRAGIARSRAPYTIYTDIDMPYTAESMCEVIDRVFAGTDVVIAVRNRSYHSRLSPCAR